MDDDKPSFSEYLHECLLADEYEDFKRKEKVDELKLKHSESNSHEALRENLFSSAIRRRQNYVSVAYSKRTKGRG